MIFVQIDVDLSLLAISVLIPLSIWTLKENFHRFKGFEIAYRIRQRVGAYYIGSGTSFASKPLFPHRFGGICIKLRHFPASSIDSHSLPASKKWGSPTIGDNCYI